MAPVLLEKAGEKVRIGDTMGGVMANGENGSSGTEFGGSGFDSRI